MSALISHDAHAWISLREYCDREAARYGPSPAARQVSFSATGSALKLSLFGGLSSAPAGLQGASALALAFGLGLRADRAIGAPTARLATTAGTAFAGRDTARDEISLAAHVS